MVVNGGTGIRVYRSRPMQCEPVRVFSFQEPDHLTRIHLKLALEDVGFAVVENADTIALCDAADRAAEGAATI